MPYTECIIHNAKLIIIRAKGSVFCIFVLLSVQNRLQSYYKKTI